MIDWLIDRLIRAIRSADNSSIWTLQPEIRPVMGRSLFDVLPSIISVVLPPSTIAVRATSQIEVTAEGSSVRQAESALEIEIEMQKTQYMCFCV